MHRENQKKFWNDLFQKEKPQHLVEFLSHNESFITELDNYGKITIKVNRGAALGENFMSDVHILTALIQDCQFTTFVKVLPSNPANRSAVCLGKWFDREISVYRDWLPMLEEIRNANGLDSELIPISTALCYFANLSHSNEGDGYLDDTVVTIEELKSQGFSMLEPSLCHELEYTQLAMKTYANYHSLSIVGLRKWANPDGSFSLPKSLESFGKTPYYVHPPGIYGSMVLPNYSKVMRHLQYPEAAQWLDDLIPKLEHIWSWDDFIQAGPLTCVLHGDAWSNNLLFHHSTSDGGRPTEMIIIDWQIARCGHPSIDILFYIFSGTSASFRKQHLANLLHLYWSTLNHNLGLLGVDLTAEGYDEERFIRETHQRCVLAMLMAFFILPITLDRTKACQLARETKEMKDEDVQRETHPEAFEDTQKKSWDNLFLPETILENQALCQRLAQLIIDARQLTLGSSL